MSSSSKLILPDGGVIDLLDSCTFGRDSGNTVKLAAKVTGEWFRNCRNLLDGCEAHMNQYLGDGFLCYWEDTLDIRLQITAALRELAKMQATTPPAFRFVLHYGKTLLSGVPTLSSLTLHGDSVHFAFRMEKIAGKLNLPILCSEAAITRLKLESLARHESAADGFNGQFPFFVPDLDS